MTLQTMGYHHEKETGELFMGHFSQWHIDNLVTWKSKRSGDIVIKGINKGKHPLFIQRSDVIGKGWIIG
ncbi:hypothetical protein KAR91_06715 [Candidatus Pacearchaeota archaeon]|nr:hypothetical protein [Candidatus Pacearchaeota archaeon]